MAQTRKQRSATSAKPPRARTPGKRHADEMNQATSDEFEREGLGIAAKE